MSEAKTKQTKEAHFEILRAGVWPEFETRQELMQHYHSEGWNAALASVILPEGRFEVGQPCEVFDHLEGKWVEGAFGASDDPSSAVDVTFWSNPADVRPLPKTVDLTMEEKRTGIVSVLMRDASIQKHEALEVVVDALASGKSLDDLCREYSVPLTKEVS